MEFRKQLGPDSVGNYETNAIWKENHPPLRSNEVNNLGRLHSLTKNLIWSNKFGEYNKIIQEQIYEGIIEKANKNKTPEKDTKPNKDSLSLNEWLETGPPLQNSLWNIFIRTRF